MDKTERIWMVLLGKKPETFADEKALRYFQFKWWLLGTNSRVQSYSEAAMIFGTLRIKVSATKSPDKKVRQNNVIELLRKNDGARLFVSCFPKGDLFSIITNSQARKAFHLRMSLLDQVRHHIRFGILQLDISKAIEKKATKEQVWEFLAENKVEGVFMPTKVKTFRLSYHKSAYLMAASEILPDLIDLGTSYDDLIWRFDKNVPSPEVFRTYLESIWGIDDELRVGGKKDVEAFAGITYGRQPLFPSLKAIPKPERPPIRKRKN